jgi:hypothetical protein
MADLDIILPLQFFLPIVITIWCNYLVGNFNDPVPGILHVFIIILTSIFTNNLLGRYTF